MSAVWESFVQKEHIFFTQVTGEFYVERIFLGKNKIYKVIFFLFFFELNFIKIIRKRLNVNINYSSINEFKRQYAQVLFIY